ncbi:MAG: DUF547 domain-containing protein [Candidatus Parcubacteria bacterium]|nr:DUF547 domain-containing protein [Burkholderiales bacterium]
MSRVQRLLLLLAFFCAPASGQEFDHAHRVWDGLLKKHVVLAAGGHASLVRYAEFAKDRAVLKGSLEALSSVTEAQFGAWDKPHRMAFLINAYNAFTVELILASYPVKSIKDIGSDLFANRWKRKFFRLLGREASLDGIEHEMLRKPGAYDDPRVHFALNCAAIGCPMLREEAYVAERLDAQLEEQARRFLSDRSRNRYFGGRLELSRIFDWYREDFAPLERYLARYAALLSGRPEEQQLIAAGRTKIAFLDYDWNLNDARP